MDFLCLLGKPENEAVRYLEDQGLPCHVVITKDPRAAADSRTEKRVIRISRQGDTVEILVGYFALAT